MDGRELTLASEFQRARRRGKQQRQAGALAAARKPCFKTKEQRHWIPAFAGMTS
jgi:hypothetical protein